MADNILNLKDLISDENDLTKVPEATVKLTVLSKRLGKDVSVKVKAINNRKFYSLVNSIGDSADEDFNAELLIALEGIVDPDFKDKEVRDAFGARTPKELVEKVLIGQDLNAVVLKIGQLSGYYDEDGKERNVEKEAKN